MGQRHQVFLIVPNPAKSERVTGANKEVKSQLNKEFGTGKTTVLAYHHQWLYGATAVNVCYNVLNYLQNDDKERENKNHTEKEPFDYKFRWIDPNDIVSFWTALLRVGRGVIVPNYGRAYELEEFWYLNKTEPEMRTRCDIGDNNDDITIIDCINRKYCFMNISGTKEEIPGSAYYLKPQEPASAADYFEAYYPYKSDAGYNGKNKEAKARIENAFLDFDVITYSEFIKLFPECTKEKAQERYKEWQEKIDKLYQK